LDPAVLLATAKGEQNLSTPLHGYGLIREKKVKLEEGGYRLIVIMPYDELRLIERMRCAPAQ
jgi:hypothetical protein